MAKKRKPDWEARKKIELEWRRKLSLQHKALYRKRERESRPGPVTIYYIDPNDPTKRLTEKPER